MPEVLCNELECLAGKLSFPSVEMPSRKPEGRERISLKEIRLTHNNFLILCLPYFNNVAYVLEVTLLTSVIILVSAIVEPSELQITFKRKTCFNYNQL